MENKKIGIFIIVSAIIISLVIIGYLSQLRKDESICPAGSIYFLSNFITMLIYISIAIVVAMLSFGFYLIFFSKGEKAIVERLEKQKEEELGEKKFELVMSGLDENEKKILKAIHEQYGIEQNTLVLRTDLSKSKVSLVLSDFEKKNLIKRVKKGKTYQIFLKKKF